MQETINAVFYALIHRALEDLFGPLADRCFDAARSIAGDTDLWTVEQKVGAILPEGFYVPGPKLSRLIECGRARLRGTRYEFWTGEFICRIDDCDWGDEWLTRRAGWALAPEAWQ